MARNLDQKMLTGLSKEVRSYLPMIREGIESFQHDVTQREAMAEALRYVHTIKGASAMIGISVLSQVTSYIEDMLEEIVARQGPMDPAQGTWLCHTVDLIDHNLESLLSGGESEQEIILEVEQSVRRFKGLPEAGDAEAVAMASAGQADHLHMGRAQDLLPTESTGAEDEAAADAAFAQAPESMELDEDLAGMLLGDDGDQEAMVETIMEPVDAMPETRAPDALPPEPEPEDAPLTADALLAGSVEASQPEDEPAGELVADAWDEEAMAETIMELVDVMPEIRAPDALSPEPEPEDAPLTADATLAEPVEVSQPEDEPAGELVADTVDEEVVALDVPCQANPDETLPESAGHADTPSAPPGALDTLVAAIDGEVHKVYGNGATSEARQVPTDREGTFERYLLFTLAGTRYAVSVPHVLEIDRIPPITPVPNVPTWVRGVINLRGDILSVIDFRTFLGIEEARQEEGSRMLMIKTARDEITTSLIVDQVKGFVRLPKTSLQTPTTPLKDKAAPYISAVCEHDEQALAVFDLERFLLSPEIRQFESV
jgi:purine-binding chemotaxis protein CheW